MDHLVAARAYKSASYYGSTGVLHFDFSGDAWGNHGVSDDNTPGAPPWGHACWMPPGHYLLTGVQDNGPDCLSEGPFQIDVSDIDDASLRQLIDAGKATLQMDGAYDIGGIVLPIGQLAKYVRDAIMLHGGGTNDGPHALDDFQELLRTFGCGRVHNATIKQLAVVVRQALAAGQHVVFSAVGTPAIVSD